MKCCITIACSILLVTAGLAFALDPTSNVFDPSIKGQNLAGPWNPQPQVGGENCGNATVIGGLPYSDGGNTCGYLNDYTATCYSNAAPDVVYRYTPGSNQSVNISLCGSSYDTGLIIYSGACPSAEVGCNDDFCGLQSEIDGVNLVGGTTYYIVVDGYSSNCGVYTLNIALNAPCPPCPVARQLEGEPDCGPGYVDNYNGGCNSAPVVLTNVTCNTICGRAGTYIGPNGLSYRDTDWYQVPGGTGNGTVTVVAEFAVQLAVLSPTCSPITLTCGSVFGGACIPVSCTFTCLPGSWIFVAPSVFTGVPCTSRYVMTLTAPCIPACPGTATETTSWGRVKGLYM